jgi:CheY-specific phosphatase CheX
MSENSAKTDYQTLDQAFVKVVQKAVKETFASFFGVIPVLTETLVDPTDEPKVDISGMIAFVQTDIEGTMSLRFQKEALFNVLGGLYGEKLEQIDSRAVGSVGEFANIIHGIAKEELNTTGCNYQICLPVVVVGVNHLICSTFSGKKIRLKYDINGSEAYLELVVKI